VLDVTPQGSGYRLQELAQRFGCELVGDGERRLVGVCTLQEGAADRLAFLANPRYRRFLKETRAGAVIVSPQDVDIAGVSVLVSDDPYLTYARMAALFSPDERGEPGVHPSAVVADDVELGPGVRVGPQAVVEAAARLDEGAVIGPGCLVGARARIGADTRLVGNVTVCHDVALGRRVLVHPGVVIGGDGFGIARDGEGWVKVPQLGSVRIGDDVEIGANTTIDRGAIGDTVIEDGVKLDNQIQIAHNVRIGAHTAIAAFVGISGSTVVGRRCLIAGAVGMVGHIEVADDVVLTGRCTVSHSITKPGSYSSGTPMEPTRSWRKNSARFRQLDELARRLIALEKKVDKKTPNSD